MQVTMQHAERLTLAEMREFLSVSNNLSFADTGRKQIYGLVEGVLHSQKYLVLAKKDKGIVRRYLVKISGLSVAQITRLIARWRERGVVQPRASRRHRFPRRYTADDISFCWPRPMPPTKASRPRPCVASSSANRGLRQGRLLTIGFDLGASQIDNLRRARAYREHHVHHTKTGASGVSIGERRKPEERGQPGYLRVDTVPQGDTDSRQGIYHINAAGTVTQGQIVGCCENHLRGPFGAGFRGHSASIPFPYPRLSSRQRLGVSQPPGGEAVEQNAGLGVHQVAGAA